MVTESNWEAKARWLAEKVMGWYSVVTDSLDEFWGDYPDHGVFMRTWMWQPHENIAQAMEILEALRQRGYWWTVESNPDDEEGPSDYQIRLAYNKDGERFLDECDEQWWWHGELTKAIVLAACEETGYKE